MTERMGMSRRVALSIVAMATVTIWLAGVVPASADDPAGNNGTVKVAGEDFVGMDSHVGCAFTVDFYGFDEGDLWADVVIDAQAPTEGGTVSAAAVFIGEDPAGGAIDLDASVAVDLTGAFAGPPNDEQGFHAKLTVHADGAQGANTKHKTFWVDCSDGGGEGEGGGES